MSVVKINAITVPDGAGPELEARFAARFTQGCMGEVPGFLGYELLRPVAGDTRYFVYTRWETDAAFQAWRTDGAEAAHCDTDRPQVGTGADLLEFETVPLGSASQTAAAPPGTGRDARANASPASAPGQHASADEMPTKLLWRIAGPLAPVPCGHARTPPKSRCCDDQLNPPIDPNAPTPYAGINCPKVWPS